jgi:hypothetical protein
MSLPSLVEEGGEEGGDELSEGKGMGREEKRREEKRREEKRREEKRREEKRREEGETCTCVGA